MTYTYLTFIDGKVLFTSQTYILSNDPVNLELFLEWENVHKYRNNNYDWYTIYINLNIRCEISIIVVHTKQVALFRKKKHGTPFGSYLISLIFISTIDGKVLFTSQTYILSNDPVNLELFLEWENVHKYRRL
jgi:hypothetical protein